MMEPRVPKKEIDGWRVMAKMFQREYGKQITWIDMRLACMTGRNYIICGGQKYLIDRFFNYQR